MQPLEWREVKGYEGLYLVSNYGDVAALPKTVKCGNRIQHRKPKPLKTGLRGRDYNKYPFVRLSKNGHSKCVSIHRLVAEAFIPNPLNLPEVNHKDENPLNCVVSNLEWCTHQYNIEYSKNKPIVQFTNAGPVYHSSISHASDATGIGRTSINNALSGWSKTAGGFRWAYC